MNDLKVIRLNGKLVTDSREVAERIRKPHDQLMRSIRGYINILDHSAKLQTADFFIESNYKNENNQSYPCYLLTKQGCEMVANKMTGKKGILFTAEYVQAFNQMEKQSRILTPQQELKLHYQVLESHEEKLVKLDSKVDDLENNMPLFNIECKELQYLVKKTGVKILGGKTTPAYKDNSIRGQIYSDIQHQLRREFGVRRYEAIKRCQLEKARNIITSYVPPTYLQDQITLSNNQMSI